MLYLNSMTLPTEDSEWNFRMSIKRTCYNTMYPFGLFPKRELTNIVFSPITIFAGGNGSGKTTLLNIIAEKLSLARKAPFNRSPFFEDYIKLCCVKLEKPVPCQSSIITSDDVFDYILDIRNLNMGIDYRREDLFSEYNQSRLTSMTVRSLSDYDALKKQNNARRKTQSAFVRDYLPENIPEKSNGESALYHFSQRIDMDALYLLDEPENSLSPKKQLELLKILEEAVRFLGCQLIISTHSPFILSLKGARIYDLDSLPINQKEWVELENVRTYFDFFNNHTKYFADNDF